jgi:hypothetical protein
MEEKIAKWLLIAGLNLNLIEPKVEMQGKIEFKIPPKLCQSCTKQISCKHNTQHGQSIAHQKLATSS